MKKGHRKIFQNAWSQKNNHFHWKNNSASKKLTNSYGKMHRTVFQNAWSQKNKHSHWKNNSVSKKLTTSYEKMTQDHFPKCLNPKKTTLSLKKQFCFKKAYNFIWKKATEPSSKMPDAKKTTLPLKKQFCFKKAYKFIWKNATEPFSKMPEAKKNQHSHGIKNYFCFKKAYKFIWKNGIEPSSKIPEAKETNTLIEKTILFQKSLQIHMKKGHRSVFQNAWIQKRQHSHWKNNSVSKKLANSYEKMPQNRFPKCLKPKKTLSLKKTILFQKSLQIHMKKCHRTVFQNAWSQKNQHSHWKKQFCFKKAYNFIWKNDTGPFSKMPSEAKKTNTLIEKTILLQKSLQIHMKKVHKTVFQNPWSQKNQHSHWKKKSVSKKLINSYEKRQQNRFPKCRKPKK